MPHPIDMINILDIHREFLLECIRNNRTILFACKVMYSGLYDDLWLDSDNLDEFKQKLLRIVKIGEIQLSKDSFH